MTWYVSDGEVEIEFPLASNASEALDSYMEDVSSDTETYWLSLCAFRKDEDGEHIDEATRFIAVDPSEPSCIGRAGHDWKSPHSIVGGIKENPGVFGFGGGLKIRECCMRCGCLRLTNTWAQDPVTGKEGLRSVSYEPDYYADELSAEYADELLDD